MEHSTFSLTLNLYWSSVDQSVYMYLWKGSASKSLFYMLRVASIDCEFIMHGGSSSEWKEDVLTLEYQQAGRPLAPMGHGRASRPGIPWVK